jgi:DNA-binding SARP family transcriptional activator/tetratricopeptide (TPR) repeat protein/DNA-binding XRE family transcriptional regulator
MDDRATPAGGLAGLIRAHRRASGLSQRQLADRVGVSVATIRDLEQGRTRHPHPHTTDALITALGLTGHAAATLRENADGPGRPHTTATGRVGGAGATAPGDSGDPTVDQPLRVRVLGPLAVHRGPVELHVGRGRRRAVLGRLALTANSTVLVAELIDLLWDTDLPATPEHMVHTYISRLRAVLDPAVLDPAGPAGGPGRQTVISRTPGGYRLNLAPDRLDLTAFRRLVREADTAPPPAAIDMLETALRYWHDAAPLADVPELRTHPLVVAALDEHTDATLRHADLATSGGCPDRCLPLLRVAAGAHPLHEPLHARLITALFAHNRQADALVVYDDIRRRLVDELGIEPGPELVQAHRRVLHQEPVPITHPIQPVQDPPQAGDRPHPPAQLPADVYGFTGRGDELASLDAVLGSDGQPTAVVITAVSGTAGIGKTALAVHWSHRVRDQFPDGQLYVNLRGFGPSGTAMNPDEAIRRFLDALDVAPPRIPADLDAKAVLYRTLLADKRMLIVLDNARDPDQVRPLLPGAPGCVVLVTSRNQLTGLIAAEGARPIVVDLLAQDEASDLLACRLGRPRIVAEPDAVDDIISRCARLPLALAIVAAHAAAKPGRSLADLAAELRHSTDRLDALATGDSTTDVRAVFSWSYRVLDPDAARLFRLLGLHPGPDISQHAAASLAAITPSQARSLLAQLTHAHLITEHTPGRYTLHDLLHAYATEQTLAHDSVDDRRAASHRMLDHYLHTADAADRLLAPSRDLITLAPPQPGVVPEHPTDHQQALTWFTAEHTVLLAAVQHADESGFDTHTWQLARALTTFLFRQGHWHDQAAVGRAAMTAAERLDNPTAQAQIHCNLGLTYIQLARHDDATTHLHHALNLYRQCEDLAGQAYIHGNLAFVRDCDGHLEDAVHHVQQALDLFQAAGHRHGAAKALNNLGWYHAKLGDCRKAIDYCQQVLILQEDLGNPIGKADAWDTLGYAYHHLGDHTEAVTCYQNALDLFRESGDRFWEANALIHLGDTHHTTGDIAAAHNAWHQALEILTDLGHPDADQVTTKLRQLHPSQP